MGRIQAVKSSVVCSLSVFIAVMAFFCSAIPAHAKSPEKNDPGANQAIAFIDNLRRARLAKDEFETTAFFQQRMAAYVGKTFVIDIKQGKVASYDADSSTLSSSLAQFGSIDATNIFAVGSSAWSKSIEQRAKFAAVKVKSAVLNHSIYIGSTAFGATRKIERIVSEYWAIVALNVPVTRSGAEYVSDAKVKVTLDPTKAKAILPKLFWRLYARSATMPEQRSILIKSFDGHSPTINEAWDTVDTTFAFTATIDRADLIDSNDGGTLASLVADEQGKLVQR